MKNTTVVSPFPNYVIGKADETVFNHVHLIQSDEVNLVSEDFRTDFAEAGQATIYQGKSKTLFTTSAKCAKLSLTSHSSVSFS